MTISEQQRRREAIQISSGSGIGELIIAFAAFGTRYRRYGTRIEEIIREIESSKVGNRVTVHDQGWRNDETLGFTAILDLLTTLDVYPGQEGRLPESPFAFIDKLKMYNGERMGVSPIPSWKEPYFSDIAIQSRIPGVVVHIIHNEHYLGREFMGTQTGTLQALGVEKIDLEIKEEAIIPLRRA